MLLLDTCTCLWLAADAARLSRAARDLLSAHAGRIHLSAISAFEMARKVKRGQLQLPLPVHTYWSRLLALHGLTELPVDGAVAIRSAELPDLHRDPADRMLVATAQLHHLTLITPDPHIHAYPDVSVAW